MRLKNDQSSLNRSGTSIIHSCSINCLANHLRASAPLSLAAWRTSRSCDEAPDSSDSGTSSSSIFDSGSGVVWCWRERTVEAKHRAWCWASRRLCACLCRLMSRRRCWSEIASLLNGRRVSCGGAMERILDFLWSFEFWPLDESLCLYFWLVVNGDV